MINDNPALKPIYYAFLPSRLAITVAKSIPVGVAFKVIDDMESFDISKKYVESRGNDEKRDAEGDRGQLQKLYHPRRLHLHDTTSDRTRDCGSHRPSVQP